MHNRRWPQLLFVSLATFALLVAARPASAQQTMGPYQDVKQIPDTPAGKCVTELLEVVNSGDQARVREFIETRFAPTFRDAFPIKRHLEVFADVHTRSGGFDFHGIRKYDQPRPVTEIVAIARARLTGAWQGFIIEIEPDPPHQIAGLQFAPARPPSDLPPPKELAEAGAVTELEKFLDQVVAADAFSGTVLLARGGKVLFKNAYGLASKRFGVPNRIDTKFNLGSMNKMFTAVAIAQLAERGRLSFDDPIGKHLDESWVSREILDKVTIQHLLTHTSGLGSHFTDEFQDASRLKFRELDDWKPLISQQELAFEPGSDWQYSNAGFYLLGAIVAKVSGQDYYEYIREHVYKPAGMVNSDSYDMDKPVPNLAIGYSKTADGWENNTFKHTIRGGPAGGGFSTVEDLLRFDQALRSQKLLSAASTEMLWSPKPGSPEYGYGFGLEGESGNRIVGHGGGFPGINGHLGMHLDSGYTLAVLSNYDNGAQIVKQKVCELLGRVRSARAEPSRIRSAPP